MQMKMRMNTEMENKLSKEKVLLGLSGGVDSATAALLLKEKGFQVTGYYFDVLGNNHDGKKSATEIASQLGIELIIQDVSSDFRNIVIDDFCNQYLHGKTPNPCVVCNPNIKFRNLIKTANEIGAYYIATGHYCQVQYDNGSNKYYIKRAENMAKDQSYMLYRLGQEAISRLIFPLGQYKDKEEIRELARNNSLKNSDLKDSQEICFVDQSIGYVKYMKNLGIKSVPGKFIDKNGNVLGTHQGILNYTLGQRKGLGIALGKPVYVTKIDYDSNQVVLGDEEELFKNTVVSGNNFFTGMPMENFEGKRILAKVRYTTQPTFASFKVDDDKIITTFERPQRAPTPGQSIVFYSPENDWTIGGGIIE